MLEKIKNLDRRWIFALILLSVIVPILIPIGLPMKTSKPVENLYNYIDSLPEGSIILMSFDFGPSTKIELGPSAKAVAMHAFRKNLRIVAMALWPDGSQMSRQMFDEVTREFERDYKRKLEYGKDYVNLGYKAGGSVLLLSLKSGFSQNFPTDVDGTPLADLPLMNDVKGYNSIAMALSFSAGANGMKEYILIVATQFGVKVGAACTAVSAPEMYSFMNSGQLLGLMGGLKGAAEYELLLDMGGEARRGMDAQSVVHMVIILFIILSNVIYFVDEYRKKHQAA
jgi:hypothetical protein